MSGLFFRKMKRLHSLIPSKGIIAYSCCYMGFSFINSIFGFYYVKVFMTLFKIPEYWFQTAQILYMIWNAINDPLFAYWMDKMSLPCTRTRRESVLYSAPLFCISFLLTWFPWADGSQGGGWLVGIHLTVTLFLYDAAFSFLGLAMCCLFTETSSRSDDRASMTVFSQLGGLISSTSVFFCDYFSDGLQNFANFQISCFIFAIIGGVLMLYSGLNSHTEFDKQKMGTSCESKDNIVHENVIDEGMWKLVWQIVTDINFISFVIINFTQMFHGAFFGGFIAIIVDELGKESLSVKVRSTFYGISVMIPHVLIISSYMLIRRYGYFKIIYYTSAWKIVLGLLMFVTGKEHIWIILLLIIIENSLRCLSSCLFNMPLSDIADDNMARYKRKHPITSMIFGTNALITKPALSLSPMLVSHLLEIYGYRTVEKLSPPERSQLHDVMFNMLCLYCIIIGAIQVYIWSYFKIRDSHLKEDTKT